MIARLVLSRVASLSMREIIVKRGSNFGDCGELSLSTLSRHVRKNLLSGKDYSRKRLEKCAGERFTNENLVYTQLYLDYLSFGHFLKMCSNTLQTSNVWLPNISCLHPIRTCFSVTCPRLDENDGIFQALCQMLEFLRPAFHQWLKSADLTLQLFQEGRLYSRSARQFPKYSQLV